MKVKIEYLRLFVILTTTVTHEIPFTVLFCTKYTISVIAYFAYADTCTDRVPIFGDAFVASKNRTLMIYLHFPICIRLITELERPAVIHAIINVYTDNHRRKRFGFSSVVSLTQG